MADVDSAKCLFVTNFRDNVSDSLLYELFLQAGPIDKVTISSAVDRSLIGVITFKHDSSVGYACDIFEGTKLFNRALVMSSSNLFAYAEMKAKEARDSLPLRGRDVMRHEHNDRRMEPRRRSDERMYNRNDRHSPYERNERRHDNYDDRYRNRRNHEYHQNNHRRRY